MACIIFALGERPGESRLELKRANELAAPKPALNPSLGSIMLDRESVVVRLVGGIREAR